MWRSKEVLDQYGSERVTLVLAATVQEKVWDGRFSNANKRWALEKEIPREPDRWSAYAVAAHPVILDDFVNLARQEMQKRERPPAAKTEKALRQPCAKAFHNHIVFSAVSLDCTRKFKDVLRSGKVVAELSDSLCREHRLSIVENPQDKTVSYDKWKGSSVRITSRDTIRMMIDSALRMQPDGFDALMQLLEEAGCRVKRGAQISVKPPSGKRFIRLDSLGSAYTEAALRNVLSGSQVHIPRIPRSQYTGRQIALLIDIEKKMREGKGRGYQVWAERHNLDAVSQSIIYLKENEINSYEELMRRIADGTKRRNQLKESMKTCQTRMKAVSEQRKAVLTYRRTQAIYVQYRESGWSPQFYQAHAKEIEAHKAAQAVYAKADGKLPTLAELSAEYERLLCQKRADSTALAEAKAEVSSLWHIKTNMDTIASDEPIEEKETSRADRNAR